MSAPCIISKTPDNEEDYNKLYEAFEKLGADQDVSESMQYKHYRIYYYMGITENGELQHWNDPYNFGRNLLIVSFDEVMDRAYSSNTKVSDIQVGDYIRCPEDPSDKNEEPVFTSRMSNLVGVPLLVDEISTRGFYHACGFYWNPDWVEKVTVVVDGVATPKVTKGTSDDGYVDPDPDLDITEEEDSSKVDLMDSIRRACGG